MAEQKTRRRALLAKIETVYGQDSIPNGAANAIAARSLEPTPLDAELLENPIIRPEYGNFEQVHVGANVKIDVEIALAGAGVVDTVPAYGVLLRACGFSETVNTGVSVEYSPVSDSHESATLYFHHNNNLHSITGARGTVQLDFNVKEYPMAKFSFVGLYSPVSTSSLPTTDFSAFQQPLAIEQSNTPTFVVHDVSAVMEKFSIDVANQVEFRSVLNGEASEIVDRKPAGALTIESPNVSTRDWFTSIKANETGTLQIIHGNTAGSIIEVNAPKVQLLQPKYGDSQGVSTLESSLSFIPNLGDDELSLVFR